MAEPTSNPPLVKASRPKAVNPGKTTVAAPMSGKAAVPVIPFAQAAAVEPAGHPASAIVLPPMTAAAVAPVEITPATPIPAVANLEEPVMNDTVNTTNDTMHKAEDAMTTTAHTMHDAANAAGTKATEMFGDMNARAKDAMAKGTKAIEELVEFSKGNMEAVTAAGRVAAKGAEEIAKYSAEYGRATIEKANATAKQFASVKSPAEFFQLQGEVAKATLDALVAEGSKFTENYLKLLGEVAQPISSRVAVASDKMKPNA